MSNETKKKKSGYVPWSLGCLSGGLAYIIISNLTYALTESYGMTAASVGFIFLFGRVFDGFTDFVAGFIIDRTHTKFGKARPYEIFYPIMWLFIVLCFCIPNLSSVGKVLWVLVMYNMAEAVFRTFITCAEPIRLERSFEEQKRVKAVSIAAIFTTVFSTVASIAMPILIGIFGKQPNGWLIIVSIFAIPLSIFGLIRFFFLPEDIREKEFEKKEEEKNITVKESLKALFSNKYIFMLGGAFMMRSVLVTLTSSTTNYYYTYVFGNVSAASIPSMVSALGMFSVVLLSTCCRKFGNRNTIIYGLIMAIAGFVLRYAAPTNIPVLCVATLLSGVGVLPIGYLRSVMVIDTITYGKWKTGKEVEGVYASVNGVVDKLGLGLGSVLVGLVLELGGYDGTLAVQPDTVIPAIKFMCNGLTTILCVVAIVFLVMYDLEKKMPQIKRELAEREEAKA